MLESYKATNNKTEAGTQDSNNFLTLPITEIRRRTTSKMFRSNSNRNKSADYLSKQSKNKSRDSIKIINKSDMHLNEKSNQDNIKESKSTNHVDSNFSFSNNSFINFFLHGLKNRSNNQSDSKSMKDMTKTNFEYNENNLKVSECDNFPRSRKTSINNLRETDFLNLNYITSLEYDKNTNHVIKYNVSN